MRYGPCQQQAKDSLSSRLFFILPPYFISSQVGLSKFTSPHSSVKGSRRSVSSSFFAKQEYHHETLTVTQLSSPGELLGGKLHITENQAIVERIPSHVSRGNSDLLSGAFGRTMGQVKRIRDDEMVRWCHERRLTAQKVQRSTRRVRNAEMKYSSPPRRRSNMTTLIRQQRVAARRPRSTRGTRENICTKPYGALRTAARLEWAKSN